MKWIWLQNNSTKLEVSMASSRLMALRLSYGCHSSCMTGCTSGKGKVLLTCPAPFMVGVGGRESFPEVSYNFPSISLATTVTYGQFWLQNWLDSEDLAFSASVQRQARKKTGNGGQLGSQQSLPQASSLVSMMMKISPEKRGDL